MASHQPSHLAASTLVVPIVAGLCALSACTAVASPGDLIWSFQGIENVVAIAETEDLDSDGRPEIAVETYDAGAVGDHIYVLRGGSSGVADTLWSAKPPGGPSNSGGWGDDCLTLGSDVTSDGRRDLLLGTAWGGRTAYALDVTNGAVGFSFDTYVGTPPTPAESGWVYTIHPIGDLTDDGVDDAIFGCGSENNGGYAVDGVTGDPIYRLDAIDAVVSSAVLGDVDDDQLDDAVFGGGDFEERAFCVSGASAGSASFVWVTPLDGGTQHMASSPDLDQDGRRDVVIGTWGGTVWCLSGADGSVLWSHPVGTVVMRVASLGDVNEDGISDVAVASWDEATRVVSGADGTLIWRTPAGGDVWAVDQVDDVTGDGRSDVVAGSFDGNVYVYDGASGAEVWSFPTGHRVLSVRGVGDLSGNGVPDVVAGTQFLNGSGGITYALEGNDTAGIPVPAVVARNVASGIDLRWDTTALPHGSRYHVDRRAPATDLRDRDEAVRAVRESALSGRDRLGLAMELLSGPSYERLTTDPIEPGEGVVRFLDRSVIAGRTYTYRVAHLAPGQTVERYLPEVVVRAAGHAPGGALIRPIGPVARPIGFEIVTPGAVGRYELSLYGIDGRRLGVLGDGVLPESGVLAVPFDGRSGAGGVLPTGVYILQLTAAGHHSTAKFVWMR